MKKANFSLGLITIYNISIIFISLVYGLHIIPYPQSQLTNSGDSLYEVKGIMLAKK